jgi:hypothetical protein
VISLTLKTNSPNTLHAAVFKTWFFRPLRRLVKTVLVLGLRAMVGGDHCGLQRR